MRKTIPSVAQKAMARYPSVRNADMYLDKNFDPGLDIWGYYNRKEKTYVGKRMWIRWYYKYTLEH